MIALTREVYSCVFDQNGDRLFCGLSGGDITVIDVITQAPIHTYKGHRNRVWSLAIDSNDTLFSSSEDCTIRSWNTTTHQQQWICQCTARVLHITTFNNLVFGGVTRSNALCIDSSNGEIITQYAKSTGWVYGIVVYGLL